MSPALLVKSLTSKGVILEPDEAGLRVRDPGRQLTADDVANIKANRAEILAHVAATCPSCAVCGGLLDSGRRYLCHDCQEASAALPLTTAPQLRVGVLLISHLAPAAYRWWEGGQPAHTTALELGASPAGADRYVPLYSQKEKELSR